MQVAGGARTRRGAPGFWPLVAAAAVGLLIMGTAGATLATLGGNTLNQRLPISADTPRYQGSLELCEGTPAGTAVWHFVLTKTTSTSAMLEVTVNGTTTQYPSNVRAGGTLHWYVTTDSPATLTAASTNASGNRLNLSDICNGGPPPPTIAPTPTPTFDLETGGVPTEAPTPTPTFDLETA